MHKLLVLYPTGQDAKKFRPYYEQTHAALVAKLPGLKASRYSFNIKAAGDASAPYYCVFEADFPDAATMVKARQSPEGAAVAADGPNYASIPPTVMHYEVKS